MITYTWVFDSFDCIDQDGLTNVIKVIRWHLIGADGDFSHQVDGVTVCDDPNPTTFTEFSQLTQEQAIEFVSLFENIPAIKSEILNSILMQNQIETVSLSPPWV